MMNKYFFISFFILGFLIPIQAQNDSISTFIISKTKTQLYQGIDSLILDWYLFIDEDGFYYLANLNIAPDEIYQWFLKRKDSDNIFRANHLDENNELFFYKKNEIDAYLEFKLLMEKDKLSLSAKNDEEIYHFQKINIH